MARLSRARALVAATVAGIALVAAGISVVGASPTPDLPAVATDRLVASALEALSAHTPVSGVVKTHVDLGLPQLPSTFGDPAGPLSVLLADQTFKYWRSPDGARLSQLLPFAERVLIVNATEAWTWDSQTFTATHYAIDVSEQQPPSPEDPLSLARQLLDEVGTYADVSAAPPVSVAGRDAYVIEIAPRSRTTLIGRIDVAIDAQTRLPLRLQVFPRGSADPAVEGGFTSVDFGPIDPSVFSFTPPAGATVKEVDDESAGGGVDGGGPTMLSGVQTFGQGFDRILAVRVEQVPQDLRPLFPYAGSLESAALVERGDHTWILAGAVAPDALAAVAPRLP